jgi:predicted phosphodiesterase
VRIALLSDVHGNLAGLRAVAGALGREGPLDTVVVAGDHVGAGPRPREVWAELGRLGWTLVRGNDDEELATDQPKQDDVPSTHRRAWWAFHAWTRSQLDATTLAALAALPFEARLPTPAGDLLVVHASPRSVYDKCGGPHNTTAEATAAYTGTGATAIAFGHYHVSFVRPMPFALLVNVASVGIPIDRQPLAAYTILTATADGWVVEQRRVPYDVDEEQRVAAAVGMPRWEPDPPGAADPTQPSA